MDVDIDLNEISWLKCTCTNTVVEEELFIKDFLFESHNTGDFSHRALNKPFSIGNEISSKSKIISFSQLKSQLDSRGLEYKIAISGKALSFIIKLLMLKNKDLYDDNKYIRGEVAFNEGNINKNQIIEAAKHIINQSVVYFKIH